MRNLWGETDIWGTSNKLVSPTGVFYTFILTSGANKSASTVNSSGSNLEVPLMDASRVAPTGPRTSPARYGVLPCVYLGA